MTSPRPLLVASLLLVACEGEITGTDPDTFRVPDAWVRPDAWLLPGTDAPMDAARFDAPMIDAPGVDARSIDARDLCMGTTCTGGTCNPSTGECECPSGWTLWGSTCAPDDPAMRTTAQVCAAWAEGLRVRAPMPWTSATGCLPGSMPADSVADTVGTASFFRWMVGLSPVTHDASGATALQACARMMDANDMLSRMPPASWMCFDADGATAASVSGLALRVSSGVLAVRSLVDEATNPSLWNRRALFAPQPPGASRPASSGTRPACVCRTRAAARHVTGSRGLRPGPCRCRRRRRTGPSTG